MPNELYLMDKCEFMKYDLKMLLIKSLELGQEIISLGYAAINKLYLLFTTEKEKS